MHDEDAHPAELFQLDRATWLALLTTQHVGRLGIDAVAPVIRVVNDTAFEHIVMFRSDPGPHLVCPTTSPASGRPGPPSSRGHPDRRTAGSASASTR